MSLLIIDVMTGEETFRNASAKSYTFLVTTTHPEKHLGIAAKDAIQGTAQIGRSQLPAFKKLSMQMGAWNHGRYYVSEGSVIKMWGTLTRYGKPRSKGVIYLQARAKAALISVAFPLLRIEGKSCYQSAVIKGNFDVLTEREVRRMNLKTMPNQTVADGTSPKPFELHTIVTEREPRPSGKTVTVVTTKGESKVQLSEAPRKIRLRSRTKDEE